MTTREALLATDPGAVVDAILRPDYRETDADASIAFGTAMAAGRVPFEAVELCLVVLSRVRRTLAPGAAIDQDAREDLARGLSIQADGLPALEAWTSAILARAATAADLDAAVAFLDVALRRWRLAQSLSERTA